MSDQMLAFCFVGLLAEIAILTFLLFRRARGSCLIQAALALFGFFAVLMVVLALAGQVGRPIAFTDQARMGLPVALVVFALMIVAIGRSGMREPLVAPRKRPLFLDMIGCAVIGAVALVLLVVAILFLMVFAR